METLSPFFAHSLPRSDDFSLRYHRSPMTLPAPLRRPAPPPPRPPRREQKSGSKVNRLGEFFPLSSPPVSRPTEVVLCGVVWRRRRQFGVHSARRLNK